MSKRLVLLTGASRGLGRAIAIQFAGSGARLALMARDVGGLEETLSEVREAGGEGEVLVADISDEAALRAVVRDLGPADVLVNNAALGGPVGPLWEADPDEWWRTVEVNLRGTYLVTRAVLPAMVRRSAGRVINIVSNAGVHRWPYMTAYATSKAAVIKMTESLAVELRDSGVRVFALNPGFVRIGLTETALRGESPRPGTIEARMRSWFEQLIAEGKTVSAEQSAEAVVKVASGVVDALSGRYLAVEDDFESLAEHSDEVQRRNLQALKVERL